MSVFREIEITWKGETVVVTPSNRILRRIEGQDISLVEMLRRIYAGQPPVAEMSFVVATLLQSAGVEVSENEVYLETMKALGEDQKSVANLAAIIAEAVAPQQPQAKN